MIALSSRLQVRQFDEEDLELLVSLASVAALHVRNVALAEEAAERRRMTEELALARRIQVGLLPAALPEVPGWELHGGSVPSREASGDYYLVARREEAGDCVVMVVDVSGKGIAAALLTASVEALAAGFLELGLAPAEVCDRVCRLRPDPAGEVRHRLPGDARARRRPGALGERRPQRRPGGSLGRCRRNPGLHRAAPGPGPRRPARGGGDSPGARGPPGALHRRHHRGREPGRRGVRPRAPGRALLEPPGPTPRRARPEPTTSPASPGPFHDDRTVVVARRVSMEEVATGGSTDIQA